MGVGSGAGATGLEGTLAAAAAALSDPAATIPGVTSGMASVASPLDSAAAPADPAVPRPWAALIFSTAISAWVGRRTPGATSGAASVSTPERALPLVPLAGGA